jgi:hypothetical protein
MSLAYGEHGQQAGGVGQVTDAGTVPVSVTSGFVQCPAVPLIPSVIISHRVHGLVSSPQKSLATEGERCYALALSFTSLTLVISLRAYLRVVTQCEERKDFVSSREGET